MNNTLPPDDNQDWLDLLAGRPAPDADAATRAEAERLRNALRSQALPLPAAEPDARERTERLLERARDAGVLAPRGEARPGWRGWLAGPWGRGAGALGLVAAVLLVAGPQWQDRRGDDDIGSTERGGDVQQRRAAEPRPARDALLAALRAAGIDAQPYERLGRPGLDIGLAHPLSDAHRQALVRAGLAIPAGPVLRVEFVADARP
jgi:hypothetical protein